MSWQEVVALVVEKELVWFFGPIALILAAVIFIWVYRSKRNGNGHLQELSKGLHLESRVDLLEKDVALLEKDNEFIKSGLKRVDHWIEQNEITKQRMNIEQGEIQGRLKELIRRLDSTPVDGNPRH